MDSKKLVVFDLDGTLNRTELYAVPAHKKALAELNIYDKSDELIISTFGARAEDCRKMLLNTTDKKIAEKYEKDVYQYQLDIIDSLAKEYDGVSAMLDKLHQDGYLTAICSNSSVRYITMVLKALNIYEKIDYIQPLMPNMIKDDTLRLLLEKVKPQKAVMVGDRVYDKNAAKANNIPFIGCKYGFKSSEVEDGDAAVDSVCEINNAVEKLIG